MPILISKKTTKRGGGGQKSPILRRHSLWTAPYMPELVGFQTMVILDPYGMTFDVVGVFVLVF